METLNQVIIYMRCLLKVSAYSVHALLPAYRSFRVWRFYIVGELLIECIFRCCGMSLKLTMSLEGYRLP